MKTATELISEYNKLPPMEQEKVVEYFTSLPAFPIEEDDDMGLEEDIAEHERILKEEDTSTDITYEDMCKKYGIS